MEPTADANDTRTPDDIGRDLLDRAMAVNGAITLEEAARIHSAIGWPPPRRDEDGAIRPPTAEELARWCSVDPAISDAMEWPEIVEEIDHRAPAIGASLLASARETVRALRERDQTRGEHATAVTPDTDESDATHDDTPITDSEIAAWTRIGCDLVATPRTFRRVVAVLANLHIATAGEAIQ